MVKTMAQVFGVILLLIGILGFVPGVTSNGMLLGMFSVNTAHNIVHLATGLIALAAAYSSVSYAKLYFQVFGVVYAIVAILGFMAGTNMILGILANNLADNILHVVIAVVALYVGFGMSANERA